MHLGANKNDTDARQRQKKAFLGKVTLGCVVILGHMLPLMPLFGDTLFGLDCGKKHGTNLGVVFRRK